MVRGLDASLQKQKEREGNLKNETSYKPEKILPPLPGG